MTPNSIKLPAGAKVPGDDDLLTIHALCRLTGNDKRTWANWLRPHAPEGGTDKRPKWRWATAMTAAAGALPGEDLAALKQRREELQVELLEVKLAREKGLVIDRTELGERLAELAAAVDGILKQKLVSEWPGQAQGLPAAELRSLGEQQHSEIVDRIKRFALTWKI